MHPLFPARKTEEFHQVSRLPSFDKSRLASHQQDYFMAACATVVYKSGRNTMKLLARQEVCCQGPLPPHGC